ncbi:hypothetical protein P43SY_006706 [Pythium insidiosum]|uniref:Protein yippee-like n=1 Tax=Pythium insidiosum TaxID=114742 RepID=A0AAD5M932_PYTIN|nr:hypothetical protein P43SY_006706 [Pythium insidiosum]KAJ0412298.1 hypothetical protein ATCC90586_009488 [Pythium insidiosum]
MGRVFKQYLESSKVFSCRECKTHLSSADAIISKTFHGRTGKAVNVTTGPPEERMLMTGLHVVVDVYCNTCWNHLGWKYEEAHEEKEKYKIGKIVLELAKTNRGD